VRLILALYTLKKKERKVNRQNPFPFLQEVLRHRDVALLAAVEALEEAAAAERLLKCLRCKHFSL